MEIIVGIVLGIMALILVGFGMWLLDGWVEPNSVGAILVLLVFAVIFVGFGFVAFLGLGAIVVALFGFLGSSSD